MTYFGIVYLYRLPFYRNDVTRSARAHEYANVERIGEKVDQTGNIALSDTEGGAGGHAPLEAHVQTLPLQKSVEYKAGKWKMRFLKYVVFSF